jgi:hypothetical protein
MTVKYGNELEGTLMGAHIYSLKQELYSEIKKPEIHPDEKAKK